MTGGIVLRTAIFALALVTAGASLAAFTRTATPASIVFRGAGPGGFKIEGRTADLMVKETEETLLFVVPLANLTTGIALRDKHMREKYLEVAKFPDTRLEVKKASLPAPPPPGDKLALAQKGVLTVHGVSREVPFTALVACNAAGACDTTAKMAININDFGISIPKYLGVTMKPELSIEVALQLAK